MQNDDYTRTEIGAFPKMGGSSEAGDTTALNTLIGTLVDSVEGYQKAAADTENTRYAEMFNQRARERHRAIRNQQRGGPRRGGEPEDDGTTTGAVHRGWMNLKEAVLGQDDETIVKTVEEGEDYLKNKFETVLNNTDLPAEAQTAVQEAWQSVKAGHDQMSQLKQAISS